MTGWLDPVASALDERKAPLSVFVRNDDAGWCNTRLFQLLDVFAIQHFPIDLAVIPDAVDAELVSELAARRSASPIGIHQHGFRHTNHEPPGRKCEFCAAREPHAQRADLETGRHMLLDRFGDGVDPIFTPPWNRCSEVAAHCLRDIGLTTLSRDESARAFGFDGLAECPIHVDWFAKRRQERMSQVEWSKYLAAQINRAAGTLGVMLHHAVMDDAERLAWRDVLRLLARHANVTGTLMRDAARDMHARRVS
jgi:hypothetical protein